VIVVNSYQSTAWLSADRCVKRFKAVSGSCDYFRKFIHLQAPHNNWISRNRQDWKGHQWRTSSLSHEIKASPVLYQSQLRNQKQRNFYCPVSALEHTYTPISSLHVR